MDFLCRRKEDSMTNSTTLQLHITPPGIIPGTHFHRFSPLLYNSTDWESSWKMQILNIVKEQQFTETRWLTTDELRG